MFDKYFFNFFSIIFNIFLVYYMKVKFFLLFSNYLYVNLKDVDNNLKRLLNIKFNGLLIDF